MTPSPDSLDAALRAAMSRLTLKPGCVGDHDGAYDWVNAGSTAPEDAPGDHPSTSGWPEDSSTVVEVADPSALAAAAREWMTRMLPPLAPAEWAKDTDLVVGYNGGVADVARKLGL